MCGCSDCTDPPADTSVTSCNDIGEHEDPSAAEPVANDNCDVYVTVDSDDDL